MKHTVRNFLFICVFLITGIVSLSFLFVQKQYACIPDPNHPGQCVIFGCNTSNQCTIWTTGTKYIAANCNNMCTQPSPSPAPTVIPPTPQPTAQWIPDSEATLAGKGVARSVTFLDWSLSNFQWAASDISISQAWVKVRNVTYALILLGILFTAFLVIITHGTTYTVIRAMRKLFFAVILITLSFACMRLLYQITDILQSFFNKNPQGILISSKDLLNLGFNYQSFQGVRLAGDSNNEQALVMINLAKLTAVTYDVIGSILLIRKIILWFYLIVSPIFCLLILVMPVKSFLKGWIQEFLRWLFYAPVFMILLSGLVFLWQADLAVLPFHFSATAPVVYPTATNLLLGGPGQKISMTNSLNYPDTFIEYVVSLIMLWVIIILPFILLQLTIAYVADYAEFNEKFVMLKSKFDSLSYVQNLREKPAQPPQTTQKNTFSTKLQNFFTQSKPITYTNPTVYQQTETSSPPKVPASPPPSMKTYESAIPMPQQNAVAPPYEKTQQMMGKMTLSSQGVPATAQSAGQMTPNSTVSISVNRIQTENQKPFTSTQKTVTTEKVPAPLPKVPFFQNAQPVKPAEQHTPAAPIVRHTPVTVNTPVIDSPQVTQQSQVPLQKTNWSGFLQDIKKVQEKTDHNTNNQNTGRGGNP